MTIPTQLCSKCHEDFMNCKCTQFFPNMTRTEYEEAARINKPEPLWTYSFSKEELRALYQLIEHQYIPYEDQEIHQVINKIAKIVNEAK